MSRILFVDDEARVLSGIRRTLRPRRGEWELLFAENGEDALALIASDPPNVVVTDMRMPGIDGVEFLERVVEAAPDAIRIVLSGHADVESALRAVSIAHQFLAKPCDAILLESVIESALALQSQLSDPTLRRVVSGMRTLPTLPAVYTELVRMLSDPEASPAEVAQILEREPAMCARVLQIANSPFFGARHAISQIPQAMGFLGTAMIKNLVLCLEIFQPAETGSLPAGYCLAAAQRHALLTSDLTRRLVTHRRWADDASMAAMLHDIGKLVWASQLPKVYAGILETQRLHARPIEEVEADSCGVHHGHVGAFLLGSWGLPLRIVEAVALHHGPDPASAEPGRIDVVAAVHIANLLVTEHETIQSDPDYSIDPADSEYLRALGVAPFWEEWRALTADRAEIVKSLF